MNAALVTYLAELALVLLLVALLAVDLWPSPPRRAAVATACTAAVLFCTFIGLVIARFVVIAG